MSRRKIFTLALAIILLAAVSFVLFSLLNPQAGVNLRADRTKLKINDTVTLTADINDKPVRGLGNPAQHVMFKDAPSDFHEETKMVSAEGHSFYVDGSKFLQLESIKRQDDRITAVFRAIHAGRTKVSVAVNGEICEMLPGYNSCNWNYITLVSSELSIQVTGD